MPIKVTQKELKELKALVVSLQKDIRLPIMQKKLIINLPPDWDKYQHFANDWCYYAEEKWEKRRISANVVKKMIDDYNSKLDAVLFKMYVILQDTRDVEAVLKELGAK